MVTASPLLRFELAGESYAFDVVKTREVLTQARVTPLPQAPPSLVGVLNLRGSVIPVVDLRRKFGLPEAEATLQPSVIVVAVQNGETTLVGAVVDAVRGVLDCLPEEREPAPRFGMSLDASLVAAIAKTGGEFVVVLDSDRLFSEDELWKDEGGRP